MVFSSFFFCWGWGGGAWGSCPGCYPKSCLKIFICLSKYRQRHGWGVLYCMHVEGTRISRRHSADCLGSSLFAFVWLVCVQPVAIPSRPGSVWVSTCCTFYKTPSPLVWHLVDSYRVCMKPKALYILLLIC